MTSARWLLGAYAVLLALLLLVPSSDPPSWVIHRSAELASAAGLPPQVASTTRMEQLLNVAAVVPLAFGGTLVRPELTWRDWTALAFVGSLLVEVVQAVALPERTPSHSDVVANTLGALLGALAALSVGLRRPRGSPPPARRHPAA